MARQYQWADLFLLPSICEGSATASYEALASGLPIIVTPNTGSIIQDGEEGFVVPIRSASAIVDRIEMLRKDAELRERMAQKARALAEQNTLDTYAARLISALDKRDPARPVLAVPPSYAGDDKVQEAGRCIEAFSCV